MRFIQNGQNITCVFIVIKVTFLRSITTQSSFHEPMLRFNNEISPGRSLSALLGIQNDLNSLA